MKLRPLTILVLVTQSVLLAIELGTKYDTFGRQHALAITNVVATLAILFFDRWLRRRGGSVSPVTVVVMLAAVWLDALGNFQHFYGQYWWWDHLTHGVGGMAVSAGFIDLYLAWRKTGQLAVTWWQAAVNGFLWGQFLGGVYEITEYLGDLWFKTQRVGPGFDTSRDLLFNLLGGVIALLAIRWQRRDRSLPR